MIQEEANRKILGVLFNATKLTGETLIAALGTALSKIREGNVQGKQTLRKLASKRETLATVPINNADLKDFERSAKKFGVSFSVMKDGAGNYIAFYKSKDAEHMEATMNRFLAARLKSKHMSIKPKLEKTQKPQKTMDKTLERIPKIEKSVEL